jgi:hypothetical protein
MVTRKGDLKYGNRYPWFPGKGIWRRKMKNKASTEYKRLLQSKGMCTRCKKKRDSPLYKWLCLKCRDETNKMRSENNFKKWQAKEGLNNESA